MMLIKSVHFSFFFLLQNIPNILMSAIFLFFAISDKIIISHKCSRNIYYRIHSPFGARNKCLMLGVDRNLNDRGIKKAINGHHAYLTISVVIVTLHDEYTILDITGLKQQKSLPLHFYIYYTQFHNSFYSVFFGTNKCSDTQESISDRFQCKI